MQRGRCLSEGGSEGVLSAPAGLARTSTYFLIIAEMIGLTIRCSLHQYEEKLHQYLKHQDLLGIAQCPMPIPHTQTILHINISFQSTF